MIIFKKGDSTKEYEQEAARLKKRTQWLSPKGEGVDHLSASSVKELLECTNKFKYRSQFRFFNLYAILGNLVHSVLEQYGRVRKAQLLYGSEDEIDEDALTAMKQNAIESILLPALVDLKVGNTLLSNRVPEDVRIEIYNKDLLVQIARHLLTPLTLTVAEEAAVNGMFPVFQEAELKVLLGDEKKLPFVGFGDSIKFDEETRIVYIDDYKNGWTPNTVRNWKELDVPKRQFWIYYKSVSENIDDIVGTHTAVVPRLILFAMSKTGLPEAMSAKKPGTLSNILKKTPVLELIIRELKVTPVVEEKYSNEVRMAGLIIDNKIKVLDNGQYGCAFCDYRPYCDFAKAVDATKEEAENE